MGNMRHDSKPIWLTSRAGRFSAGGCADQDRRSPRHPELEHGSKREAADIYAEADGINVEFVTYLKLS
jgi:hypothetical protein